MKRLLIVIFSLQLLVVSTGCSKEKQTLRGKIWEIESIRVHKDSVLVYSPFAYNTDDLVYIRIHDNNFELSGNGGTILGKVQVGYNKINFKNKPIYGGIFFHQFSEDCAKLLVNNVTRYNVNNSNSTLVLTGDNGEIINCTLYWKERGL